MQFEDAFYNEDNEQKMQKKTHFLLTFNIGQVHNFNPFVAWECVFYKLYLDATFCARLFCTIKSVCDNLFPQLCYRGSDDSKANSSIDI